MSKVDHVRMEKGIFYREGKPYFLLSADYPYYRDLPENWESRLRLLKEAHVRVISFYVPWRHHLVQGRFDFTGETLGNRNVKQFIRLCAELDLLVLLKPGPFIHAETDFGGLPDMVCPDDSEIEAMLDGAYSKRTWHRTLPAPYDARFLQEVEAWYAAVDRELIQPFTHPAGPVVALQILNEGLYSDGQHPVTDYDYSPSSIQRFHAFLQAEYGSIEAYNSVHVSQHGAFSEIVPPSQRQELGRLQDWLAYRDWAAYQGAFMAGLYREWSGYLDTSLPFILNVNPPHDRPEGYDDWLNRLQIESFDGQNYGFTNWIGVVSHDESAFLRYLLLTKRGRGPNLEENWGFSKLYDYRYQYTAIPFFQTILAVAGGATGYNIYTGVNTDQWDDGIDTMQQKPYPDCAPITEHGEITEKYASMKLLNRFFHEFGDELLSCKPVAPVTWALYDGYAQVGCWGLQDELQKFGVKPPLPAAEGLAAFQRQTRGQNLDFHLLSVAGHQEIDVQEHPFVVLSGGFFMNEAVQETLVRYVQAGGHLLVLHEVPTSDERLAPCRKLAEDVFGAEQPVPGVYAVGDGQAAFVQENVLLDQEQFRHWMYWGIHPADKANALESNGQAWLYQHPEQDVQYVFVLGLAEQEQTYYVQWQGGRLEVQLPSKSSSVVRLKGGELDGGVVKGLHEFEKSETPPCVTWAAQRVEASAPCDLFFARGADGPVFETAVTGARAAVQVEWTEREGG